MGGRDSRDGIRDFADAFSGHMGKLSGTRIRASLGGGIRGTGFGILLTPSVDTRANSVSRASFLGGIRGTGFGILRPSCHSFPVGDMGQWWVKSARGAWPNAVGGTELPARPIAHALLTTEIMQGYSPLTQFIHFMLY